MIYGAGGKPARSKITEELKKNWYKDMSRRQ
jgi:hypothetical protein